MPGGGNGNDGGDKKNNTSAQEVGNIEHLTEYNNTEITVAFIFMFLIVYIANKSFSKRNNKNKK